MILGVAQPAAANSAERSQKKFDRFIVKYQAGTSAQRFSATRQRSLDAAGRVHGMAVSQLHRIGTGADVVRTNRKLDYRAAQAFMNQLRRDPAVEYVEIDKRLRPTFTPNDPLYNGNQWHYYEAIGGIGMPAAWDLATGTGVVVAVLDSGIPRTPTWPRTWLRATTSFPTSPLPTTATAATPTRAIRATGWRPTSAVKARRRSPPLARHPRDRHDCRGHQQRLRRRWHRLQREGDASARARPLRRLVVRYRQRDHLGQRRRRFRRSGQWQPGRGNQYEPRRPRQLRHGTQAAINSAVAAGMTVVVSAGNESDDTAGYEPANCNDVIAVAASNRAGGKSGSPTTAPPWTSPRRAAARALALPRPGTMAKPAPARRATTS